MPRAELAPAGYWNAQKRGDEFVADASPRPRPVNAATLLATPLSGSPLTPALAVDRPPAVFRFSFKLVTVPHIDTIDPSVVYESDVYEMVDQWDGDSGRACLHLEDDLQRLVLRPGRRVVVTGGYV